MVGISEDNVNEIALKNKKMAEKATLIFFLIKTVLSHLGFFIYLLAGTCRTNSAQRETSVVI